MEAPLETDELLTPREVAAILRCHPRTLGLYRQTGRLKYEKLTARTFRYRRSAVEQFRHTLP